MQCLTAKCCLTQPLFRRFAALKALMPGHEKADKATFLSNIVAYIKQLQVRKSSTPDLHRLVHASALCGTQVREL